MGFEKFKIIILIFLIALVIFSLSNFLNLNVRNGFFSFFSPLQKFLWRESSSLSYFLNNFLDSKGLGIENENLKKENFILKEKILELEDLRKNNEIFKKALELGIQKDFDLVFTEVLLKKSEEDSILVSSGSKDGILIGMPLINEEKILIGKINKVLPDFSEVDLISKNSFTFSVEVKNGEKSLLAVAKGKGGGKMRIELLPKDSLVEEGDIVSTSLLGGKFLSIFLVGEIKNIDRSDSKPFQEGEIIPYFKDIKLEKLFIVKNFPLENEF